MTTQKRRSSTSEHGTEGGVQDEMEASGGSGALARHRLDKDEGVGVEILARQELAILMEMAKPYLENVETKVVLRRLVHSLVPMHRPTVALIADPDLYGPIVLTATKALLLQATGFSVLSGILVAIFYWVGLSGGLYLASRRILHEYRIISGGLGVDVASQELDEEQGGAALDEGQREANHGGDDVAVNDHDDDGDKGRHLQLAEDRGTKRDRARDGLAGERSLTNRPKIQRRTASDLVENLNFSYYNAKEVVNVMAEMPKKTRASVLPRVIREAHREGDEARLEALATLTRDLLTFKTTDEASNPTDGDKDGDGDAEMHLTTEDDEDFVRVLYADASPMRMTSRRDIAEMALLAAPVLGPRGAELLRYAVNEAGESLRALAMRSAVQCSALTDEELVAMVESSRSPKELQLRAERVLQARPKPAIAEALYENLHLRATALAKKALVMAGPDVAARMVLARVDKFLAQWKIFFTNPEDGGNARDLKITLAELPMKRFWDRYGDALVAAYEESLKSEVAQGGANRVLGVFYVHFAWSIVMESWKAPSARDASKLFSLLQEFPPLYPREMAVQWEHRDRVVEMLNTRSPEEMSRFAQHALKIQFSGSLARMAPRLLGATPLQDLVDALLSCTENLKDLEREGGGAAPVIVSACKEDLFEQVKGAIVQRLRTGRFEHDARHASGGDAKTQGKRLLQWCGDEIVACLKCGSSLTLESAPNSSEEPFAWGFALRLPLDDMSRPGWQEKAEREKAHFSKRNLYLAQLLRAVKEIGTALGQESIRAVFGEIWYGVLVTLARVLYERAGDFSETTAEYMVSWAGTLGDKETKQRQAIVNAMYEVWLGQYLESLEFLMVPRMNLQSKELAKYLGRSTDLRTSLCTSTESRVAAKLREEASIKALDVAVTNWRKYALHSAFDSELDAGNTKYTWDEVTSEFVQASYSAQDAKELQRTLLQQWESLVSLLFARKAQGPDIAETRLGTVASWRPPFAAKDGASARILGTLLVDLLQPSGPRGSAKLGDIVTNLAVEAAKGDVKAIDESLRKLLTIVIRAQAWMDVESVFPQIGDVVIEAVGCREQFLFSYMTRTVSRQPALQSGRIDILDRMIHAVQVDLIPKLETLTAREMNELKLALRERAHPRDEAFAEEWRDLRRQSTFNESGNGRLSAYMDQLDRACARKSRTVASRVFSDFVRSIRNEQGPNRVQGLEALSRRWPKMVHLFLREDYVTDAAARLIASRQEASSVAMDTEDSATVAGFAREGPAAKSVQVVLSALGQLTQDTVAATNMDARLMDAASRCLRVMLNLVMDVTCSWLMTQSGPGDVDMQAREASLETRKAWYATAAKSLLVMESVQTGARAREQLVLAHASVDSDDLKRVVNFDGEVVPLLAGTAGLPSSAVDKARTLHFCKKEERVDRGEIISPQVSALDMIAVVSSGYEAVDLDQPFGLGAHFASSLSRITQLVRSLGQYWPATPGIFETITDLVNEACSGRNALCNLSTVGDFLDMLEKSSVAEYGVSENCVASRVCAAFPTLRAARERLALVGVAAAKPSVGFVQGLSTPMYDEASCKRAVLAWQRRQDERKGVLKLGEALEARLRETAPESKEHTLGLFVAVMRCCTHDEVCLPRQRGHADVSAKVDRARALLEMDESAIYMEAVEEVLFRQRQDQVAVYVAPERETHENFAGRFFQDEKRLRKLEQARDDEEREDLLRQMGGLRVWDFSTLRIDRLPYVVARRVAEQSWADFSNGELASEQRTEALKQWLANPALETQAAMTCLMKLYEQADVEKRESGNVSVETQRSVKTIIQNVFEAHDPFACLVYLLSPEAMQNDFGNGTAMTLAGVRQHVGEAKLLGILGLVLGETRRKMLRVGVHKAVLRLLTEIQLPEALALLRSEWARTTPALHVDVKRVIVKFALACLQDPAQSGALRGAPAPTWPPQEAAFALDLLHDLAVDSRHEMQLRGYLLATLPSSRGLAPLRTNAGEDDHSSASVTNFWMSDTVSDTLRTFSLSTTSSRKDVMETLAITSEGSFRIDTQHTSAFCSRVLLPLTRMREGEEDFVVPMARVRMATVWATHVPDESYFEDLLGTIKIPVVKSLDDVVNLPMLDDGGVELFQVRGLTAGVIWHRFSEAYNCRPEGVAASAMRRDGAAASVRSALESEFETLAKTARMDLNTRAAAEARMKMVVLVLRRLAQSKMDANAETVEHFLRAVCKPLRTRLEVWKRLDIMPYDLENLVLQDYPKR
ncbi:Hypothetical Protein FCC1311_079882 [Hondaea fermentalgiana]|uniref:Uncharacterized protein n=1 Tax=Hondaea fermentalgiana TaxID=2315210 RepID=A0A2R5GSY2_9STRA|nr:Hypothetical Protein FCC1311_079882 [Hondaea fermentalgiana]|eukprot:GBG31763.1 Hypothetical Protein FCC1311_079882 [Hondaea fermentalgiana]